MKRHAVKLADHVRQKVRVLADAQNAYNLFPQRLTGYYRSLFSSSAPEVCLAENFARANRRAADFRTSLKSYAEGERITP